MTAQNLTSFVRGLARTNVTAGTNAAKGLTCVCPGNDAFAAMNHLDKATGNLIEGPGSLLATLTRHGIKGSYYSTDFRHGDLLYSQNGYPILVSVKEGGEVYLNDARLVMVNAVAVNGATHALDRIMGFLNTTTNVTTPANATEYSNPANIPTPPPIPATTSATSFSPSPTATSTASSAGGGNASSTTSLPAMFSGAANPVMKPTQYSFSFSGLLLLVLSSIGIL